MRPEVETLSSAPCPVSSPSTGRPENGHPPAIRCRHLCEPVGAATPQAVVRLRAIGPLENLNMGVYTYARYSTNQQQKPGSSISNDVATTMRSPATSLSTRTFPIRESPEPL